MRMRDQKKKNSLYSRLQGVPVIGGVSEYVHCNLGILCGLVALCIFLTVATSTFATSNNILNILRQITTNVCLTIGIMMAILLGGIDLTGGAIIALSGCVAAKSIMDFGQPVMVGILLGLGVGLLVGLINGVIIAYTDMPPFIVTLAMQNVVRGAAYLYADGNPIRISNDVFENIRMGYAWGIPLPVIYSIIILFITFDPYTDQDRPGDLCRRRQPGGGALYGHQHSSGADFCIRVQRTACRVRRHRAGIRHGVRAAGRGRRL